MKIHCPNCNQKYGITESLIGNEIECHSCKRMFTIPTPSGYVASATSNVTQPKVQEKTSQRTTEKEVDTKETSKGKTKKEVDTRETSTVTSLPKPKKKSNAPALAVTFLTLGIIGAGGYYAYTKYIDPIDTAKPSELVESIEPIIDQKKEQEVTPNATKPSEEEIKPKTPEPIVFEPVGDVDANIPSQLVVITPSNSPAKTTPNQPVLHYSDSKIESVFQNTVKPYFEEHCITCHGPDKERGDLRVDQVLENIRGEYAAFHLQNIIDEMTVDNMPPEDEPRPDASQSTEVIQAIGALIESEKKKHSTGGGRPFRRLTRSEFINMAYDYFGVDLSDNNLPDDLHAGAFETDTEHLLTTGLHVENYMDVARDVAKQFITDRNNPQATKAFNFFKSYSPKTEKLTEAQVRAIISKFSVLTKRGRPASAQFSNQLVKVYNQSIQQKLKPWEALEEPLAMTMFSLDSLFIYEASVKGAKQISGLDLANRLSFSLWRSAPDAELVKLGRSNELLKPEVKKAQIQRMLKDPKFNRFVTDFTDQWFELGRQDEIAVQDMVYRKFNPAIKTHMKQETIEFYRHLLNNNLPITNLIDSDFMVLNEEMAKFYGIRGVTGSEFRAVKRDGSFASRIRGGMLTHAGILMQGSNGDRSHLVERGAFIARKLIDDAPAEPPPNVEALPVSGDDFKKLTSAQLFKKHANAPQCATCHNKIDPLGVALENFDVIGQFRTEEVVLNPDIDKLNKQQRKNPKNFVLKLPIQNKGIYYNGQEFHGLMGLKQGLMDRKDDLGRGYIKALLTYINGRKVSLSDEAVIDEIIAKSAENHYPARTVLESILLSDMMSSF